MSIEAVEAIVDALCLALPVAFGCWLAALMWMWPRGVKE